MLHSDLCYHYTTHWSKILLEICKDFLCLRHQLLGARSPDRFHTLSMVLCSPQDTNQPLPILLVSAVSSLM